MDPFFLYAAAASFVVMLSFLAGCAFMAGVCRRAVEAERAKLRECLERGNKLVHSGEDVLRRVRASL